MASRQGSVLLNQRLDEDIGTDYTSYEELARLGLDEEELAILRDAEEVRCDTPDPTQYHDPSQVVLEHTGRAITEQFRPRRGLGGTIIPRATRSGGSRGFDQNRPAMVNIIDLQSKTKVTIDLSAVDCQQVERAVDTEISEDLGTVAAIAFHRLAKMQKAKAQQLSKQEINMSDECYGGGPEEPADEVEPPRKAPMGMGGAYVVPRSTRGGKQMQTQAAKPRGGGGSGFKKRSSSENVPSQKSRAPSLALPPRESAVVEALTQNGSRPAGSFRRSSEVPYQEPESAEEADSLAPTLQVHFEHEGVYEMRAPFHESAVSDVCLVLVYDTRWTQGNRFEPKPTDDPIFIQLSDRPEEIYRVYVPGLVYEVGPYQHQLFFIDEVFASDERPAA